MMKLKNQIWNIALIIASFIWLTGCLPTEIMFPSDAETQSSKPSSNQVELREPIDGQVLYQNQVILKWKPIPKATAYHVIVYDNISRNLIVNDEIIATQTVYTLTLKSDTSSSPAVYAWAVRAKIQQHWQPWSAKSTFKVQK